MATLRLEDGAGQEVVPVARGGGGWVEVRGAGQQDERRRQGWWI